MKSVYSSSVEYRSLFTAVPSTSYNLLPYKSSNEVVLLGKTSTKNCISSEKLILEIKIVDDYLIAISFLS